MERIRRLTIYLLSFVLARGALFLSPIVTANFLKTRTYGELEWGYAAASVCATIGSFGVTSVLPLIVLKNIKKATIAGIFVHHIFVGLVCAIAILFSVYIYKNELLLTAAILTAATALQALWSVYLKTYGKGEASLILDSGLFVLIALTAFIGNYFNVSDLFILVLWMVGGYAFCLFYITLLAFLKRFTSSEDVGYSSILKLGFPIMIATLVAILAATSGRLAIGYLGGLLLIGNNSILDRAAA